MPTDHWPVRPPSGTVHAPAVNIDDVDPVMIAQSYRNLWRNRFTCQGTDRRPDRRDTKPLASDAINHMWPIVPVAIDINWRRVCNQYHVLSLNFGKLISCRLQHRRMACYNQFRSDRAIADDKPRPPATNLLTDARFHRPEPRHQRPIHMDQAGRPADLRLGSNFLRQTVRSAPRESQIRQHQDINMPLATRWEGPHRFHGHKRLTG